MPPLLLGTFPFVKKKNVFQLYNIEACKFGNYGCQIIVIIFTRMKNFAKRLFFMRASFNLFKDVYADLNTRAHLAQLPLRKLLRKSEIRFYSYYQFRILIKSQHATY